MIRRRVKSANIKDVAKMANVSVATVSRVLNKTRHVSEEIEKAVLEAARELATLPTFWAKICGRSAQALFW